jgi:sec-independent protein translocase protein TatB
MFGFSFGEILVISIVALLVLGPERIPHVARNLGRLFAELRRATDEVRREFNFSEFTKNEIKAQLKLPSEIGLRTDGFKFDEKKENEIIVEPEPVSDHHHHNHDNHSEPISEPLTEPEPHKPPPDPNDAH